MQFRRICTFLFVMFCMTGWASEALARIVPFRIIYTMDLHGQIRDIDRRNGSVPGGALRCAGLIRELDQAVSNAVVVSAGGDLFGTPESDILKGSPVVEMLNSCGCDIYLPTGRDFSRGLAAVRKLCAGTDAAEIAANLKPLGEARPMPSLKPFEFLEFEGVKIAFAGLADNRTPAFVHPSRLRGLEWASSLQSLAEAIPRIRDAGADIIVLLTDRGLTDRSEKSCGIETLAAEFPSIDLIVGRRRRGESESIMLGETLFVSSGSRGRSVGYVDLEYDTVADEVVAKRAHLRAADDSTPVCGRLADALRDELERAAKKLTAVLGKSDENFPSDPSEGEVGVGRVLLRAVQEAVDADIAILPASAQSIWRRAQTERDLWRIVPHQDRIATMSLTINQIEEILRENADFVNTRHRLEVMGLEHDPDDDGSGFSLKLPDGSSPHPRRKFRVAVSSYLLSSAGGKYDLIRELSWRPHSSLFMSEILVRDALRIFLREHNPLDYDLFQDLLEKER